MVFFLFIIKAIVHAAIIAAKVAAAKAATMGSMMGGIVKAKAITSGLASKVRMAASFAKRMAMKVRGPPGNQGAKGISTDLAKPRPGGYGGGGRFGGAARGGSGGGGGGGVPRITLSEGVRPIDFRKIFMGKLMEGVKASHKGIGSSWANHLKDWAKMKYPAYPVIVPGPPGNLASSRNRTRPMNIPKGMRGKLGGLGYSSQKKPRTVTPRTLEDGGDDKVLLDEWYDDRGIFTLWGEPKPNPLTLAVTEGVVEKPGALKRSKETVGCLTYRRRQHGGDAARFECSETVWKALIESKEGGRVRLESEEYTAYCLGNDAGRCCVGSGLEASRWSQWEQERSLAWAQPLPVGCRGGLAALGS
ncbi:hypothetical protein EsH8_III_001078 [Colletotrichum jinshuiense]